MMRKLIVSFVICVCGAVAYGADTPVAPPAGPLYSIFSTSTDWQAVTGLRYNGYELGFQRDKELIGSKGLLLYYLDGFPCYGLGDGVRAWLGPNGQSNGDKIRVVCVYPPTEIKFAYSNVTRDANISATTGMLVCPVKNDKGNLTINLGQCTRGPDWNKIDQ